MKREYLDADVPEIYWETQVEELSWDDYPLMGVCGGCGQIGVLGKPHFREGEECGEFV